MTASLEALKRILTEDYNYSEFEAEITAHDMLRMDETHRAYFFGRHTGQEQDDLVCRAYSVNRLMKEHGMTLPAAVLLVWQLGRDAGGEIEKMLAYGVK